MGSKQHSLFFGFICSIVVFPVAQPTAAEKLKVVELRGEARYIVACAMSGGSDWLAIAEQLAHGRSARSLIIFDTSSPHDLLPHLQEQQPEYVAYVIPPKLITPHLAGQLAEISSRIDEDPLVDFASGFVTGITPEDALHLVQRTLDRESREVPIPRICTGIGHSWRDQTKAPLLMLQSREAGRGATIKLRSKAGNSRTVRVTADAFVSSRFPEQNYQAERLASRLFVSPNDGRTLLRFESFEADAWDTAVLTIPLLRRQAPGQTFPVVVSPLTAEWEEDVVTWNRCPMLAGSDSKTSSVRAGATQVQIEVTSVMDQLEHGLALHSTNNGSPRRLRHMYFAMQRLVNETQRKGFEGQTIEAVENDQWKHHKADWLRSLSRGGLLFFGGHGSGSSTCLVASRDLQSVSAGPFVVINGTCFANATHEITAHGYAPSRHRRIEVIAPEDSFALQLLRAGALTSIGGTGKCSFAYVDPAIALLRDQHQSVGQALQAVQNGFIERVAVDAWSAHAMRPEILAL